MRFFKLGATKMQTNFFNMGHILKEYQLLKKSIAAVETKKDRVLCLFEEGVLK
jgi:hypothetical protein